MLNKNNTLYSCRVLLIATLMLSSQLSAEYIHKKEKQFKYALSSGVFSIHRKALSVDWQLINNSNKPQKYRVTIYEINSNGRKVISPGSLTGTLEPAGRTHNANSVGEGQPFKSRLRYEIVIEVNTKEVLPNTEMWSSNFGSTVIPETIIRPKQFRKIK